MAQLSNTKQYQIIAYLGFSFMIMFAAFNSFQDIISQIYEEYHF